MKSGARTPTATIRDQTTSRCTSKQWVLPLMLAFAAGGGGVEGLVIHSSSNARPIFQIGSTNLMSRTSSTRRCSTKSRRRCDTSLNVRFDRDGRYNDDDAFSSEDKGAKNSRSSRWWNSVFDKGGTENQQDVVDGYLEFLDRRYHRMKETVVDEPKQAKRDSDPSSSKQFSVLNWLKESPSSDSHHQPEPESDRIEEDALYVLEVASLASDRLLQKHAKSKCKRSGTRDQETKRRNKAAEEKEVTTVAKLQGLTSESELEEISSTDGSVVNISRENTPASLYVSYLILLVRRLKLQRRKFVRLYSTNTRVAVSFVLRSMGSASKRAIQMVWTLGGGKKSISMTFSALLAFFILLRPFAQASTA